MPNLHLHKISYIKLSFVLNSINCAVDTQMSRNLQIYCTSLRHTAHRVQTHAYSRSLTLSVEAHSTTNKVHRYMVTFQMEALRLSFVNQQTFCFFVNRCVYIDNAKVLNWYSAAIGSSMFC